MDGRSLKCYRQRPVGARVAAKDHPQYARLSEVLRPGDVLVVWEPSRAGRPMDHYVDVGWRNTVEIPRRSRRS
ncbi:hypothetical protein GS461_01335 [Rhodococcus hoagii]|nr:hypothetical protein [Prescottella equi]